MLPVALTIAGSDPSGGAGIQADLKTFHQFGVYGEAAITLITVQNTRSLSRIEILPADLVVEQIEAVVVDIRPRAAKVGALGSVENVEAVAELAASFRFPLVVDPVMISKHGVALLREGAVRSLREKLFPRALLVTPNVPEAEVLARMQIETEDDMIAAGERILEFGCKAVLVKGGHFPGEPLDVLVEKDEEPVFLRGDRVETTHTHGAGCTYSAAITAGVACGQTLDIAVRTGKRFMQRAIEGAPRLGSGNGPVDHFAEISIWERLGRSYRSRQ